METVDESATGSVRLIRGVAGSGGSPPGKARWFLTPKSVVITVTPRLA
jgi:hypothetical protein